MGWPEVPRTASEISFFIASLGSAPVERLKASETSVSALSNFFFWPENFAKMDFAERSDFSLVKTDLPPPLPGRHSRRGSRSGSRSRLHPG